MCPSQARIVLLATPERSQCVAVGWRIVCGLSRLPDREGTRSAAWRAARSTRVGMPKRIDVAEWQHVLADGVKVTGLATAAPLPRYRRPLFPVDAEFFAEVLDGLQSATSVV